MSRVRPQSLSKRTVISLFIVLVLLSLAIGATVIVFVNPIFQIFSLLILALLFLGLSRYVLRLPNYCITSDLLLAYCIFATAALISILASALVASSQILIPFVDTISVIAVVLLLTKVSGKSLRSIYLTMGKLRLGLTVGLTGFFVLFAGILIGFQLLYGNSHAISFGRILSLSPIILVLAFLNAPKEEIWFRGLFLGKSEKLFSKRGANLLQVPLFTIAHYNAQYSQFGIGFQILILVIVFSLGLFWGYFIQKTDSVIGSSLVHAGADIGIYLPVLLSLL